MRTALPATPPSLPSLSLFRMTDEVGLDELEGLLGSVIPHAGGATVTATNPDGVENRGDQLRKGGKRRKREFGDEDGSGSEDDRKRSKYVLDAAESSDGEDDFVEESEEGFEDEGPRYEPHNNFIFHEGDHEKTAEDLGREFEERDQALRSHLRNQDTVRLSRVDMSSRRFGAGMLPRDTDPKVFAIKCRPRMARALVARIVNKCYAYRMGLNHEKKKVDLGIISAFCIDHIKEYIYVEAYRKLFVENALSGLEGLFRFQISVVDPTELLQMLEKRPSNEKVRVGTFVRLRQRFYRMDLAQVTHVHQDGVRITCKVVPREDFVGKTFNKPTTQRVPQFFVASRALGVEDRHDHYRWGDLQFDREGYLLKIVSTRMVIFGAQMEKPTAEELARFYNNNRERVREAIARTGDETIALHIGDTVRVSSGQLRDTVGAITNIFSSSGTATIACRVPGRKDSIELRVELSSCVKHFAEGTHVIVQKGEHAGESGTVVKSWGDVVLLFPDRSTVLTEIKVLANDCHQSKLAGSFSHSYGSWQLFDLVTIPETNAVGCIVGLTPHDMTVVTERNETQTLTHAQVKAVTRSTRQTTDPMQNVLVRGSEVFIQHTAITPMHLGGESGRVQQVFNRTLFVCCRSIRNNASVVAVDAACVLLLGGRTTTRTAAPPKQLPVPQRRPHNATKADMDALDHRVSGDWHQSSEWHGTSSLHD